MAIDHDAIGQYGPYRVVREIGRGGMGVVYEVVHVETDQRCALKVLPAVRSANARIVERFRREAEATRRIRHRNIIGVHHAGCEQGLHYFVMDLIDGRNLEDIIFRLRRNAEDVGDFLSSVSEEISESGSEPEIEQVVEYSSSAYVRTMVQLIREVADALHVSHAAGLVHRDIKPSNLILSREGRLVLTDFGLVQDMQAQTFTQTGEVLGTPLYMSPEQIAGKSRKTDGATDVYSLGATLYEALSLKPPFTGADLPSLVYQIQFVDAPPLSTVNPGVSKGLSDIVAQAMAKTPSRRFDSSADLAADLGRYLDGRSVKARPPGRVSRFRQALSRHPEIKAALFVAMGIVVLVLGYEFFDLVKGRRQGKSEFNSYAEDSERLLLEGNYGPAWRAIDEALRRDPKSESALAQRRRILQQMLLIVQQKLEAGGSLNEPLRLAQQMHRFAQADPLSGLAIQQVLQALKATIRTQAIQQEYGLAQDLLERYRGILQDVDSTQAARAGVEELRQVVAGDLMEAAVQAFDSFQFQRIAAYVEAAEAFGVGATLPSPDTRLLQDFSGRGWGALQGLAQRALSDEVAVRARAIGEISDARTFVRLPYQDSTRLVRQLLTTETDVRLRQGLLDLVRDLGLNDMAGELLAMVSATPTLEPQVVPVFQSARDPRCRSFLIGVSNRASGPQLDAAIAALGSYRDADVERALVALLKRTESPKRIALCCWALARINAQSVAPYMLQLALKSRGDAAVQIVDSLVRLRAQASVEDVKSLREKVSSGAYQARCLRLLEGDTTAPVIAYLVSVLNSKSVDEVRAEAALALGRCRSHASIFIMKQVLFNQNETLNLRSHSALALGQLPAADSVAVLKEALDSADADGLRLACARALGSRYGDAAASAALVGAFSSDVVPELRRETAIALTRLGHREAIGLFAEALMSYDPGGTAAVFNSLSNARTSSARAFSSLLKQVGLTDGPGESDGLQPQERLIVTLCESLRAFALDRSWRDQNARANCVQALQRILTLPRAPAIIQAAAVAALSAYPKQMAAKELQSLMKGLTAPEVQRAGVLALARLGETRTAHEFFAQLTDYSAMDCFNYACVWGLAGNTSRAGVWLTKAAMLGFSRVHLIRNTRELNNACRLSRIRVLFDL